LTEPTEKALIRDLAPAAAQGRAFGYYNFIVGISAIPAGYLTGALWDQLGGSQALIIVAAIALFAVAGFLAWERAFAARPTAPASL
jgi:hypothetical protein